MRTRLAVTALSALLLTSACGGSDAPSAQPTSTAPSAAPSTASTGEAPATSGERTTIFGSVGSKDNPESFEINLTDADGKAITELPAGDYEVKVTDKATIHNFHLTGPGVDEKTGVQGTDDATFDITLEKGKYDYECDPHVSSMNGSFTVT